MNKKATIYDIAREAGVSTATVTRVVRRDPHVREATRLKVQQIIYAQRFRPEPGGRPQPHPGRGASRGFQSVFQPHL